MIFFIKKKCHSRKGKIETIFFFFYLLTIIRTIIGFEYLLKKKESNAVASAWVTLIFRMVGEQKGMSYFCNPN